MLKNFFIFLVGLSCGFIISSVVYKSKLVNEKNINMELAAIKNQEVEERMDLEEELQENVVELNRLETKVKRLQKYLEKASFDHKEKQKHQKRRMRR